MILDIKRRIDRGQTVNFAEFRDPHIAANLVKVFLKSLPAPLLPTSLFDMINAIPDIVDPDDKLRAAQWLVQNYVTEPEYSIIKVLGALCAVLYYQRLTACPAR